MKHPNIRMKQFLLFSAVFLAALSSQANFHPGNETPTEVNVESSPKQVTVFLTGAELRHSAQVNLVKGKNLVKFTGLSSKLDPNSIVVDAEKKNLVIILSVYSSNNFLVKSSDPLKVKPIKDSIARLNDQLAKEKGSEETLDKEKQLLYQNDVFTGRNSTINDIQKAADFFRKRSNELNDELYKISKRKQELTAKIDLFTKQLAEINAAMTIPRAEINALVLVTEATTCGFDLKYRVNDAGWEPKYDIRVDAIAKPVNLFYKANIFNNTGVDWMEVKLRLSTADPLQGAERHKLEPWKMNGEDHNNDVKYQQSQIDQMKKNNAGVNFKTVEVNELTAEFDIEQPYSILSDSKPYLVDVLHKSLDAKYEYVSVPKMDKDAFLVAKVVGWSELNLVSGDASIYFNGTYIGQSVINIIEISDTLELSLGRDSKVAISRIKKSEVNEHQIVGNFEKEVHKYEMVVKNNREIPLTIRMQDQVPVKTDSRMDIKISEISGGAYNKSNGEVEWTMTLAPGETRKLTFNFSTRYPKDVSYSSYNNYKRKYRTVSCPKF